MNDNISRALEVHPTPWRAVGDDRGREIAGVYNANGVNIYIGVGPACEDVASLTVEAVNAYAAQRERDEQVKALAEAAQEVLEWTRQAFDIDDPDPDREDLPEWVDLQSALAPFTQE
jgi:hypothetical protein